MSSFDIIVSVGTVLMWIIIVGIVLFIVLNRKKGDPLVAEDAPEQYKKLMDPIIEVAIYIFILVAIYDFFID